MASCAYLLKQVIISISQACGEDKLMRKRPGYIRCSITAIFFLVYNLIYSLKAFIRKWDEGDRSFFSSPCASSDDFIVL
jgi:hypothetical protein